jgi:phage terminase large subunit GpA-like protein
MLGRVYASYAPPPDILVSEWARRNRILPKGTTSRPGPFVPELYQVEMMDVICDPNVHEIVIKKSTQVGYSDAVLNNIIGYFIDIDPKPIMLVQPRIDDAKDYGKKRIGPMIETTPALRAKIRAATSRRAGNTLQLKEFPGGFLKLTGANSGAGLRSDPVPIVLFDEVEGYPLDVDGEGDPVEIGKRRTDQFSDYKTVEGSTPAKEKSFSRIEKRWNESDQRLFHVPCPFCGHAQPLFWRDPETKAPRLLYRVDADNRVIPASVGYKCRSCEKPIPERYKSQMLNGGKWIATHPGRPLVGFWINALYSPWKDLWHLLAQEWVDAQKDREKLKAFINLRLAECWEEEGFSLESHHLRKRCEEYCKKGESFDVPRGVGLLTAAVDVQDDRLEAVVKGWGAGEESWLIAYEQFFGDPGQQQVWDELDKFLRTEFRHASGRLVSIEATMIDSGGHHTDSVYRFVKPRQARHVFALKGSSEAGKEILAKFSMNNQYRVKLYTVGTDTAKDRIFSRMMTQQHGPGYMHLPTWVEDEYIEQLTSEKRITRYKPGKGLTREYVKTRSRNEALDLEVYVLAALYTISNHKLRQLAELADALNEETSPEELKEQARQRARKESGGGRDVPPSHPATWGGGGGMGDGSGWVNGWRD